MLSSQALSLKVMRAPVPGALWVRRARVWRKSGVERVMVKDSQVDSAVRV